jgi:cytochrome c oxidase subunit II
MMDQQSHTQVVLADGVIRRLQNWWWDVNFRGYGDSTFAAHSDWLFFWIFAITAFFFVLLMALMFYFMVKYRKRPGGVPLRSRSHNTALELTWSIVPTIILVWMFFEGFRGYANMSVPPAAAPEILITGQMWNWSATYPNGASSMEATRSRKMGREGGRGVGVTEVPIFVVPEQTPIRLRMHSTDVMHSFWIPDFRSKFDVYPNRYTTMWFESLPIDIVRAERNGWLLQQTVRDENNVAQQVQVRDAQGSPVYYQDHWVFCAEYCGQMHSEMAAIIRVVPREQYLRIMQEWATPTGSPWEIGRALARIKGCFGCHSIDGAQLSGPTWLGLFGSNRQFTDGTSTVADENYIRESILEPGRRIVTGYQNLMQSYQGRLTEEELNNIINFIRSPDREPPMDLPEGGTPADDGEGQRPQGN